ncbi:hypothetical protein [Flavivirga jejuensis]|uniref:Curli production assembly/transport component CsgG n=1 Tax=Flavivirga jejuensis TaxID=870487 RepID=A0ABT8WTL0_9FLAO|nr:hypothetical protein [Flavivirga jejuensis]MDO5976517.1 hypothetical protein [Flavivirga jejuensis]
MKLFKKVTIFCVAILCYKSYSQETPLDIKYKRSSLYTLILSDENIEHSENIQTSFVNTPIPEKFNNHIINTRTISKSDLVYVVDTLSESKPKKKGLLSKIPVKIGNDNKKKQEDDQKAIHKYLDSLGMAKSMLAKWFHRSEKGGFDMSLVAERGLYNASDLDVKLANQNERGKALLADAGEQLIKNTFVIVNDFKYTNKEEVAAKAKSFLTTVSSYAGENVALVANAASKGADVFGKGYIVRTRAYLYKLVWNEEVAAVFYNDFWTDDNSLDLERKKAFDETSVFKLEFVGVETGWADVQSTTLTTKTNEELIEIATVRAADNVIAKLQREYEVFRTKTPLLSGDPLSAKIGLKEGLKKGSKYEVLEQIVNKQGIIEYKRIGVITVNKDEIWDNTYLADEETPSEIQYSTFNGSKNKYYSGMLIRQIN